MEGPLWKCNQSQCRLATSEESRGLEIQNALLEDMKIEFKNFPGRRNYVDVTREESPPPESQPEIVVIERPGAESLHQHPFQATDDDGSRLNQQDIERVSEGLSLRQKVSLRQSVDCHQHLL